MSITSPDDRLTEYNPVVPTAEFPAQFPVFDNGDIAVYHNGIKRTDFTVSATYADGISNDAKAVFTSPGITGVVLVAGERAPRRTNRFGSGGPLPIRDQNLALDTATAESQELARDVRRSLKMDFGAEGQVLPAPDGSSYLGWDEDGRLTNRPNLESLVGRAVKVALDQAEQTLPAPLADSLIGWGNGHLVNRDIIDILLGLGVVLPPGSLELIDGGSYDPSGGGFGPDADGGGF